MRPQKQCVHTALILLLCGILISFYNGVKRGGISCKNPRVVYCVATPLVIPSEDYRDI